VRTSHNQSAVPAERRRLLVQRAEHILCVLAICSCAPHIATAQNPTPQQKTQTGAQPPSPAGPDASADQSDEDDSGADDSVTLFPHPDDTRYWISGQANIVLQGHPGFRSPYSGINSFTNWAQSATTHLLTLYTGYQLTQTTEVFADIEDATGTALGNSGGLAGYSNLDAVRLVEDMPHAQAPYLARLMLRQIIPLTSEHDDADRDEFDLATSLPTRRIEFRAGKFDLGDFFDVNSYTSDSELQFLNWTTGANGAYDYAANSRGYTDAALVEYDNNGWAVRFAEALMPKTASGEYLDADIARARSENLEIDASGNRIAQKDGAVRVIAYLNHADMGNYREAVANFLDGKTTTPDIIATREQGRHKYGFGLNVEQTIVAQVSVFGRLGWNDGHNESFCFTEDDHEVEIGASVKGNAWRRSNDSAATAFVANGITAAHQQYLALGGLGFMLGDGGLTYGHEKIFETFYTAHLWRGFFASYDFQHINNPGYNQVRGPVAISSFRFHTDF
jgi:hypothetical protein